MLDDKRVRDLERNMIVGKTAVYDIRVSQTVPGEMGRVVGTFKFDGRTKARQTGAFTHIPGADPDGDIYISFKVLSVRKGQKIRKEMKECQQKQDILSALRTHLESESSQNGSQNTVRTESDSKEDPDLGKNFEQEYGVDTERELAAAHSRSNALIAKALKNDPELRAYVNTAIDKAQGRVPVEAALGKHHDDLLEIPDFLKRS